MSRAFDINKILNYLIPILLTLGVIKLIWSIINFLFLPSMGVDITQSDYKSSLYTPFKLGISKTQKKTTVKRRETTPLRMLSLEGVYKDTANPKESIAIISKGGLSKVVKVGDSIFGFILKEVQGHSVILQKSNQNYTLKLPKAKVVSSSYTIVKESPPPTTSSIKEEDGQKIVPRKVINDYKKDMKKIWQNIAISDYKERGVLKGFRVRYIKKGSIFEKLGLKRGDIIVGINGESVKSYSLPMRVFSNIDTLDGLILQVKRGNNEVELEYEIR